MSAQRQRLPSTGEDFAGHRIERVLGRGGMGVVYLARHLMLDRERALKLLPPEYAHDDHFRNRFIRESRAAARLEHPNIIPIHEAAEVEGLLFLSMRFVEGSDLKHIIEEGGRLDPRWAMHLLGQVAEGLDAAHASKLVHRDIKPQNILVASGVGSDVNGHVYLLDFGLTKDLSAESQYTRTGTVMGTVHYMAPEQVKGGDVDHRTDIYSLACVMFECLSGAIPYDMDSQWAVMNAHVNEPPPKVSDVRPELPPAIDAVMGRALEKKKDDRFDSAGEFISAARTALGLDAGAETIPSRSGDGDGSGKPSAATVMPGRASASTVAPAAETMPSSESNVPQGETVTGAPAQFQGSTTPPPRSPRPGPVPREGGGRGRMLGLVAVAALIILLGVGALLFLGGGDETSQGSSVGGNGSGGQASEKIRFEPRTTSEPPGQLGDFPDEIDGATRINLISSEGTTDFFAVSYGDVGLGVEITPSPEAAQEECVTVADRLSDTGFQEVSSKSLQGPGGSEVGTATVYRNDQDEEAVCWTNGTMRNLTEGGTAEALELMNALPF
jgi:serine/threonine protein kinase